MRAKKNFNHDPSFLDKPGHIKIWQEEIENASLELRIPPSCHQDLEVKHETTIFLLKNTIKIKKNTIKLINLV
jgi:hypothetical protein